MKNQDKNTVQNTFFTKKNKLSAINTVLLIAILSYLIIGGVGTRHDDKQAYVVTGELFAQFNYQKELDTEFKSVKNEKERELELLRSEVIALEKILKSEDATQIDLQEYQLKLGQYQQEEHELNNQLLALNEEFTNKIWTKLNEFVQNFGKEREFDVIFGADGSGNIMYATETLNVTSDLVEYCNNKYSGR